MAFDRRTVTLTVPNPAATVSENINLAGTFCRILGFKILLTGTDTAVRLSMIDADARTFYLDAADKDYKTAAVQTLIMNDDTTTGLSTTPLDATGAAASAGEVTLPPIVRAPITVGIINGGTAGDVVVVDIDYEYGRFWAQNFTMPVAASSASTLSVQLRSKFAQIYGFKILSTGTSTTQRFRIKDADNRIVYLDAADKDYDTAAVDKTLVWDDTTTGLTMIPRDATGAAATAAATFQGAPLVRSPVTFDLTASEGNDEIITGTLYYATK